MKLVAKSFVGLSFVSLLSACGSSTSSPSPDAKPLPQVSCSEILTSSDIETFVSAQSAQHVSSIRGQQREACLRDDGSVGEGFRKLELGAPFVINGTYSIHDDVGGLQLDFPIETRPVDESLVSSIQAAVRKKASVTETRAQFETMVLGDLPEVHFQVLDAEEPIEDEPVAKVLRLYIPSSLRAAFLKRAREFQAGSNQFSLYAFANPETSSIAAAQAKVGEPVFLGPASTVSVSHYLNDLWVRIQQTPGAASDREIPFAWMSKARVWWPNLKLQPSDAQRDWASAWQAANGLWNPPTTRTHALGAKSAIEALNFLLTLDPSHPAKAQKEKLAQLAPFVGAQEEQQFNELMELNSYGPTREALLFKTAEKLKVHWPTHNEIWRATKELCAQAKFNEQKINSVFTLAEWMRNFDPQGAFEEASRLVLKLNLTHTQAEGLKEFYRFLVRNKVDRTVAYAKSIEIVAERRLAGSQFEGYRATLEALLPTSFAPVAFEKAEDYSVARALELRKVRALVAVFNWIYSTDSKNQALAKAEEYVFIRGLDAERTLLLRNVGAWLSKTDYKNWAIQKAEEYIIEKRLSEEQIGSLRSAYNWLIYISTKALAKAEEYAIERKITQSQIEQLSQTESWLRTTPFKAQALAKAERYVFELRLSRQQTEFLEIAYIWIRDKIAISEAVARVERYVIEKGLDPAKFQLLREEFTKAKSAGEPTPLAKAEKAANLN